MKNRISYSAATLAVALGVALCEPGSAAANGAELGPEQARYEPYHVFALVSLPGEEPAYTVVDVPALIAEVAQRWGIDETALLRIAWCESRWSPDAVGPDGAAGLFQFMPATWGWVTDSIGYPGASPHNVLVNVEAAAWLYARYGPRHWGCG